MATMAENVIVASSENSLLMLEKGMYDRWKTRIILYIRGKENGEMLKDSIDNNPYQLKPEITAKDIDGVTDIHRPQKVKDLVGQEKLRYDSDIKAINILLLGLLVDIYTLINHYQTLKEIWDRVKELMEGTEMTKQERESMLYDEFDKFTYELGESIHSYLSGVGRQSQGYAGNARKNQVSRARVVNPIGNAGANQKRVIICYNCNGEGHIAKKCTAKKKVKDSEWFKDKMLLAPAQEIGVVLNEEQQDFLADSLEETDDCKDLQLQAIVNFKADHVDAYDSDCDDEATTNVIFMANLSPVGSINDDTVEPCYDSDILFEVPYYDTYHDYDMLNSNIQELIYIENIVSNNESYNELTSNSNVISYTDYMLTIGNDADNYVPSPVQKNDMMLSVIEQIKSQVEKYNMVNQETQSVNESLTNELE
ncbi:integrase, catalytic region, zinc finger, CCHC-type containing protein [Tanacetum coccineum]